MFEKIGQAAEQVAANVSRRGFLGKLGQCALAVTGLVSGLALLPGVAQGQVRLPYCTYGVLRCGTLGASIVCFYGYCTPNLCYTNCRAGTYCCNGQCIPIGYTCSRGGF